MRIPDESSKSKTQLEQISPEKRSKLCAFEVIGSISHSAEVIRARSCPFKEGTDYQGIVASMTNTGAIDVI
jgi:hypothetical protein